jgi:dTDP-4-amino-4,6-dideoxygalactose transaminase
MQAAILRIKLARIEEFNRLRRRNAHLYNECLRDLPVTPPFEDGKGVHVYHQYTILAEKRDQVQKALTGAGIACAIYYPIPLHRQEVFRDEFSQLDCPVSERLAQQVLSLPMFPEPTEDQIKHICGIIGDALA